MSLPADVPSLALDDHTASTVSGASQGRPRLMSMRTDRMREQDVLGVTHTQIYLHVIIR